MSDHVCQWLDAAECAGLRRAFFRANERVREPLRTLQLHLFMMCRAHFAAERSYQRFTEAQSTKPATETILVRYLEAHSLIVSAKLAWETLAEIKLAVVALKPPRGYVEAIKAATLKHAPVRLALESARNRIEHTAAQIRAAHGGADPAEPIGSAGAAHPIGANVFPSALWRTALGTCDGTALVFGDERFDLADQAAALADLRDTIAPSVLSLITPSLDGAALDVAPASDPLPGSSPFRLPRSSAGG